MAERKNLTQVVNVRLWIQNDYRWTFIQVSYLFCYRQDIIVGNAELRNLVNLCSFKFMDRQLNSSNCLHPYRSCPPIRKWPQYRSVFVRVENRSTVFLYRKSYFLNRGRNFIFAHHFPDHCSGSLGLYRFFLYHLSQHPSHLPISCRYWGCFGLYFIWISRHIFVQWQPNIILEMESGKSSGSMSGHFMLVDLYW